MIRSRHNIAKEMRSTSIIVIMLAAADLTYVDCFGNLNNKLSISVSHQLQMHSADEVRRPAVYSPPLPAGSASEGKMRSSTATVDGKKGNKSKKFFIETHGCQMNLADSEVIRSVLLTEQYVMCDVLEDADLILTNTCSIRSVQTFLLSLN